MNSEQIGRRYAAEYTLIANELSVSEDGYVNIYESDMLINLVLDGAPAYLVCKLVEAKKISDKEIISKWFTKSGGKKKPKKPTSEKNKKNMATDLIRLHMHQYQKNPDKYPGGREQVIAISMSQAGLS